MSSQFSGAKELIGQKQVFWAVVIFISLLCAGLQFIVHPMILAVAIVGVMGLLFTLTRPYLGLLLYFFIMVLRPAELWGALQAVGLERIMAGFVVVSFGIVSLVKERRVQIVSHPMFWLVIAFFAAQALTVFTSVEKTLSAEHTIEFLKKLVFIFLMIQIVSSVSRLRGFVWFHIILMSYIAISALIAYMTGNVIEAQGITRIKSLTSAAGDPNSLAASMAITLPFVYLLMKREKTRILQVVLIVFGAAMVYAIILSGSRGGLLGLIACFFGLWVVSHKKIIFAFTIASTAALIITVMPAQYIERYSTIGQYAEGGEVDASSQARLDTWKAGIEMFLDYPLMGVGANAFGWAHAEMYSPDFSRSSLKAHSLYVQVLAELGLMGLIAFGMMVYMIFRYQAQIRRTLRRYGQGNEWYIALSQAIVVSLGVLFVTGIFGHSLYRFHWILMAGLTVIMCRLLDENQFGADSISEEFSSQKKINNQS